MNLFKKRQPQNLAEWLEIATKWLAASPKERIQTEIQAHYAEAIEKHIAGGLSESAAQTAALDELGEARIVARDFRKRHLTEHETKWIEKMLKSAMSIFILTFGYLMFVGLWCDKAKTPIITFLYLEFLVLVMFPTIAFVLARRNQNNRNTRLVFLLRCFSGMMMGGAIGILYYPSAFGTQSWTRYVLTVLIPGFSMFYTCLAPLTFWKKLPETHTTAPSFLEDAPPTSPAS